MTLLDEPGVALMQQRAIALIRPLIPPDAKERVERTLKQYDRLVRERIREDTRLGLGGQNSQSSIPIRAVDGFSLSIVRLIDKFHEVMLWRLITLQPKLGGVVEGLGALLRNWDDFEHWSALPRFAIGGNPALARARDIAHALQTLVVTREVLEEIKQIHEDILGTYWHTGPKTPRIEIYWMAQALFAAAFNVRLEDLTIVTLAHELAHGYTHVGRDADGNSWDRGFGGSDKRVTEGLAQHYTAVVTENLSARAPEAYTAYKSLLAHQSGPYLAHESWFQGNIPRRAEIVRFAMLRARSCGAIKDEEWRMLLAQVKKDLTGT